MSPTVVVVGDLMCDEYICGVVWRAAQESPHPVPVLSEQFRLRYAGGVGNTALNIAATGSNVKLVARFGVYDEVSGWMQNELKGKISCYHSISDDAPLSLKTRIIDHNYNLLCRYDRDCTKPMPEYNRKATAKRLGELIADNSTVAVVVSDYSKGFLDEQIRQEIVTLARTCDVPLFVDCKHDVLPHYAGASSVQLNLTAAKEASADSVHPSFALQDPFEHGSAAGLHICKKYNFGRAVITLGQHGSVVVANEKTENVPTTPAEKVISMAGAGDVFMSVFVAALLKPNVSPAYAAHLANTSAGAAVQRPYTCNIYR